MTMWKKFLVSLSVVGVLGAFAPAFANNGNGKGAGKAGKAGNVASVADARQAQHKTAIQQGVKNGSLTKREARRLKKHQKKIARVERRFAADGVISPEEAAKLTKMQDRASKRIQKQTSDKQVRKAGKGKPGRVQ